MIVLFTLVVLGVVVLVLVGELINDMRTERQDSDEPWFPPNDPRWEDE